MPQRIEFEGAIHEFPDDFTDEDIAAALGGGGVAAVIQEYQPAAPKPTSPYVAGGVGLGAASAKAIPAVLSKAVNPAAKAVSSVEPVVASLAGSIAGPKGAAMAAGAPKVAGIIAKATAPAGTVASPILDASGRAFQTATQAGPAVQGASALSRILGKVSLPAMLLSSLYDTYQGGQARASKLDDPTLSELERELLLRELHSAGGF